MPGWLNQAFFCGCRVNYFRSWKIAINSRMPIWSNLETDSAAGTNLERALCSARCWVTWMIRPSSLYSILRNSFRSWSRLCSYDFTGFDVMIQISSYLFNGTSESWTGCCCEEIKCDVRVMRERARKEELSEVRVLREPACGERKSWR